MRDITNNETPGEPQEGELFQSHDNFHILTPEEIEKQNRSKGILASYGGDKDHRYGDSPIISVGVQINGTDYFKQTSIQLELKQTLNGLHEFTLRADPDEFGEGRAYLLQNSRAYLGARITFQFRQHGRTASIFTGLITELSTEKQEGIHYLFIKGCSPSVLMENNLNCRSFENKIFEEIINEVIKDYPKDLISYHINPEYKEKIPYTVQYLESDFSFLQRLFSRYGEYHYYNGESFCLSPFGGRITGLMEGEDIYNYGLKLNLKPQNFSFTSYDPKQGKTHTINSKEQSIQQSENPFAQFAKNVSDNTFTTSPTTHYNNSQLLQGRQDIQKAVEREQKKRQNLTYMEATTNNPSLRIGDVAKVMVWMPGHEVFKDGRVPGESYKIIELTHRFADGEGYTNTFVGVPKDLTVPDTYNPNDHPKAEVQHAVVTDNKDPLKMGRIRVQFAWQKTTNQQTPWIQVLQPHGGADKGTYMNPEIGETVLCIFQGGNAECPVVLGTAYNGAEIAAYYTEGNDIKVIQTRSGTKIIFNDAEGSILIEDPSGSRIYMDGQGNITTDAPETYTVNCKNMNLNIQQNMNTFVGGNKTTHIGGSNILNIKVDYILNATNIMIQAIKNFLSQSTKLNNIASEIESHATDGDVLFNAKKTIKDNSGEKNTSF